MLEAKSPNPYPIFSESFAIGLWFVVTHKLNEKTGIMQNDILSRGSSTIQAIFVDESRLITQQLHAGVLGLEAKGVVEGAGDGISFPDVEGDVVAALLAGESLHVFEKD